MQLTGKRSSHIPQSIPINFDSFSQIFCSLACMAKATVQAALGPVMLRRLRERGTFTPEEKTYAETILTVCILSIVVTAPIGAILISLTGTRLLTKTKPLAHVEGEYSLILTFFIRLNMTKYATFFRLASESSAFIV